MNLLPADATIRCDGFSAIGVRFSRLGLLDEFIGI